MLTIANTIAAMNNSAKKVFGSDINMIVARAPAFGNDDVCLIIQGRRQDEVAADLLRLLDGGKVGHNTTEFMGQTITSTVIEWRTYRGHA